MAHEISIRSDGEAECFFAGDGKVLNPAWHGLGVNVVNAPNSADALKLARLDWQVILDPVFVSNGSHDVAARFDVAGGYNAVRRSDTKAVLGIVGERYTPIQNVEGFDFLDGLVQDGIIKYESAGALKGGKIVWMLARTHKDLMVADGDPVRPYVLFTTAHDGSRSATVMPTTVRVVCANTLRMAMSVKEDREFGMAVRHCKSKDGQLAAARKLVALAVNKFDSHTVAARKLVKKKVTAQEFSDLLDELIPLPKEGDSKTTRALTMRENAREAIRVNFYDDPRQTYKPIYLTAWAAFNAVTQYADHDLSARSDEHRMLSALEGTGDALKQKAWDNLVAMAA
jgi:phage/plasmid-like protein (TIGR03299 family)